MIVLGENRYGKSRVRLMKVIRRPEGHSVFEWTVDVYLTGEFTDCFATGDNSGILPTDTMKNTVYSRARLSSANCMESFAIELSRYLVENNPHADSATVAIRGTHWRRIIEGDRIYETAFQHGSDDSDTTSVTFSRTAGLTCRSGVENLSVLKTAKSAFSGFMRDSLTTLKETEDRLFGTLMRANWEYAESVSDFPPLREKVMKLLLGSFAEHDSKSVQQTLYAMAEAVLIAVPEIIEIELSMPNKHCNLVDLSAFGQDNPNEIFVPIDEPHGSIEARLRRAG